MNLIELIKQDEGLSEESVSLPGEEWSAVVGFPAYRVSSLGRLRSIVRRRGARAGINGGILFGWKHRSIAGGKVSCISASLRKDEKAHERRMHHLVLEAFVGPRPDGMEGCHNDGNPENNAVGNLRWDTHAANMADQAVHGTKSNPPIHLGENHPKTKLTEEDVKAIRAAPRVRGMKTKLANIYGVAQITITRIINREVWRHVA